MAVKNASKEGQETNTTLYEVGFLVTPFVGEDALTSHMDAIRGIITEGNGIVTSEGALTLTKLAYSMDHKWENKKTTHDSAYFGWMQFRAEGTDADEIGKKISAQAEVIRSLLIKTEEPAPRPVRSAGERKEAGATAEDGAVSDVQLDEAIKELVS
jgi:ribosomal protein S6